MAIFRLLMRYIDQIVQIINGKGGNCTTVSLGLPGLEGRSIVINNDIQNARWKEIS